MILQGFKIAYFFSYRSQKNQPKYFGKYLGIHPNSRYNVYIYVKYTFSTINLGW